MAEELNLEFIRVWNTAKIFKTIKINVFEIGSLKFQLVFIQCVCLKLL